MKYIQIQTAVNREFLTPEDSHVEPKNHPIVKEKSSEPNHHFQVPCYFSGLYFYYSRICCKRSESTCCLVVILLTSPW